VGRAIRGLLPVGGMGKMKEDEDSIVCFPIQKNILHSSSDELKRIKQKIRIYAHRNIFSHSSACGIRLTSECLSLYDSHIEAEILLEYPMILLVVT
jgi:hypothetical protein